MSERDRESLQVAERTPGHNPSADDYDKKFNDIASRPDMQALNDQGDAAARDSVDKSRQQLAGAEKAKGKDEKKSLADTPAGKAAMAAGAAGGPAGKIAAQLLGRIKTKQGGAGVVIGAVILLIMSVGLFTTVLAPIAFIENVVNDLNDQLAALDIRQNHIMRVKVTYDEKNKAFKGCSKLSIRCKAKSLSKRQVKYFADNDIKVNGTVKFGRTFPDSYEFKGGEPMKPAEFVNEMKTNNALRISFKRAVNMKFLGFADTRFIKWTSAKLGISKKKPVLVGDEAARTKELATQKKSTVTVDSNFIPAVDKDGNAIVDPATGEQLQYLEGDPSGKTYTQAQVDTFKSRWSAFSSSKFGSQALKAVSIIGWADMACSVKNMIGMTATTSRVLTQYALAEYASKVWSLAHAQKSSDISPEDSTALNNFVLQTDARAEIEDPEATIRANSTEGDQTFGDAEPVKAPNKYFGKNVMDSPLYQMSSLAGPAILSPAAAKYSLGFGRTSLLKFVGATAENLETILNVGAGNAACDFIQNWAVRGIAAVVGVIAAFFSGGSTAAYNIAVMVAIGVVFFAVSAALLGALTNAVIPDDIDQKPEEKAAALWTGQAVIMGSAAQARGMYPASADEIVGYQKLVKESVKDYVAIETQDVSPFDVNSPYSAAGKLVLAMNQYRPSNLNATSVLASVMKLNSSVTQKFFPSAYAADPTDRFKQCDDTSYSDIGVDADVQCNPRFVMSTEDLERDAEAAMEYMESNGYVEIDPEIGESVTGLPEGYTPPNPQQSSGAIQSLVSGAVNSFYDTRTFGATPKAEEYGKFLDYCVYRTMPYGNTYEESGSWGSAESEWKSGEWCSRPGLPYSAFRTYTIDVTVHDITEEVDEKAYGAPAEGDPTGGTGGGGTPGTVSGTAKSLAQQLLDLEKAGKIRFAILRSSDVGARTTPELQLVDIAAGKNPAITTRCGFSIPGPIVPDPKILQFLVNLGKEYNYMITSLFGQCHSQTSLHYDGKAVDFNCPVNTALADKIGAPLGVKRNWETCAEHSHWHYGVYN